MLLATFHRHRTQVTLLTATALPSHGPKMWLVLNDPTDVTSGRTAQNVDERRLDVGRSNTGLQVRKSCTL